ncbi:MAG TPA: PAS domain-containing protein [Verrucomicrobiae bacterium]|nr:PAS domain-containing protein [Verrucomicrobiae bacterium]
MLDDLTLCVVVYMTVAQLRHKPLILRLLRAGGLCFAAVVLHLVAWADPAPFPARVLREYAVTSASARERYPDPRDWVLLGSNDGGYTWTQLDAQSNQVFRARSQRRVYHVENQTAYNTFRLLIKGGPGVQLAEWELGGPIIGVNDPSELQIIASASKAHPLMGAPANAFDGDTSSRWIDFGVDTNTCWIQCQYTLDAKNLVTNVAQLAFAARLQAAHNPFFERAGQVLADYTNLATRPMRVLAGYALTSANDVPARDPKDWRLLGSKDHGATWQVLDVRRNETFGQRFQRRVFSLTNEAPYSLYRLQIDCVRVPADQPGGATCVQLAEIEPIYSARDPGGKYSILASAEGDNPPVEAVECVFDGKPRTKWLNFPEDDNTNRASWVQWEYLPGGEPKVINLRWVKALQARRLVPIELNLEGVVVYWNPATKLLGFLDETGFQQFNLRSADAQIQIGDRVLLTGRFEIGSEIPTVVGGRVTRLSSPSPPVKLEVGDEVAPGRNFFPAIVEARVTSASEDSAHWTTLDLDSDSAPGRMVAKIRQGTNAFRFFAGCRLRLEGIEQTLLEDADQVVAGEIWVPGLQNVSVLLESEKDWVEWPLYSLKRIVQTNSPIAPGSPVRVTGTVVQQDSNGITITDNGTNVVLVRTASPAASAPGAIIDAVGFLDQSTRIPSIVFGKTRQALPVTASTNRKDLSEQDALRPVTEVHTVYERLEAHPGKPFAVRLRGVITYIDLEFDSFYLQDGPEGILIINQLDAGLAPLVRQEGAYIEVRGRIDPDLQAVVPEGFVTILGRGAMPEPRRHSWDYMITGKDDAQWVQIEGVVSDLQDTGLTLIVAGGRLTAIINDFDKRSQERLLGSLVRLRGVCSPVRDNRNRRVGLQLMAPYSDCIEVLQPAPAQPFDLPTRRIAYLANQVSRSTNLTVRLTKTTGVVTYKEPKLLFIQDGNDGIRILTRSEVAVQVGDRVEAVGFSEPDGFSPRLVQAQVRAIGHDGLPAPNVVDLTGPDITDQDATLVQVQATLAGIKPGKAVQVLELTDEHGDKSCSAFIPITTDELPAIPIGSQLKLTGVLRTETEIMADQGPVATSFQLYLSSPQAIAVLHQPSWWTAQHTLWVAGALGTVLLIALTWASSLRKQVLQRTEQLHEEIQEHKRTEEALATSDRFMRSLVESLPQSIVRKDLAGRFTFANQFFCRTIGKRMDQVVGKTDFDLFPAELAAKFRRDDEQVISSGKMLEMVEQNRNASGKDIFVQVIKSPLVDSANQIIGTQVIFWDVTERRLAEARLEEAQKAMVDASRQAGMAEVAAGVLHNVGNVLNSVNVSASVVGDTIQRSKSSGLTKAVALLREHEHDLGRFFETDPRGKQLITYLARLAECLTAEQGLAVKELHALKQNIEHIKEIVAMQQSYAKVVGVTEKVKVTDLVEDALRLNSGTLAKHEVELKREYDPDVPEIIVERHKVLQILVNLIRNAKYACDESGRKDKQLVVRVTSGEDCVRISTADNGVGIASENLTRIFNHGFTTRKDGHGFGLHSGALAAREMGGTLVAHSEGPGKGATFILSLPLKLNSAEGTGETRAQSSPAQS